MIFLRCSAWIQTAKNMIKVCFWSFWNLCLFTKLYAVSSWLSLFLAFAVCLIKHDFNIFYIKIFKKLQYPLNTGEATFFFPFVTKVAFLSLWLYQLSIGFFSSDSTNVYCYTHTRACAHTHIYMYIFVYVHLCLLVEARQVILEKWICLGSNLQLWNGHPELSPFPLPVGLVCSNPVRCMNQTIRQKRKLSLSSSNSIDMDALSNHPMS